MIIRYLKKLFFTNEEDEEEIIDHDKSSYEKIKINELILQYYLENSLSLENTDHQDNNSGKYNEYYDLDLLR